jgi:amino acid transporter
VLLLFILLSIFACAVAAMATASRLLFSLSRDRILPFSGWISRVDTQTQTPRNAILLIWLMSICVVVFFQRIEMITNISALASYIGYAGIMLSTLIGNIPPSGISWFYPARWERPLQLMAFAWTLLVAAALSVPETQIEGFETRHLPAISTGFAILAGILLYMAYVRKQIRSGKAGPPGVHSK